MARRRRKGIRTDDLTIKLALGLFLLPVVQGLLALVLLAGGVSTLIACCKGVRSLVASRAPRRPSKPRPHELIPLLRSWGYTCQTGPSDALGSSLVLHRDGRKVLVLAQHGRVKVGPKSVQRVAEMQEAEQAAEGWVVTRGEFKAEAVDLSHQLGIRLIGGRELETWFKR